MDGSEKSELVFQYDINVNASGEFTTTIPKTIADMFQKAGVETGKNHQNNLGFFMASTCANLEHQVKDASTEFLSREIYDSKIILKYTIETYASYCINQKNEIVPNGGWVKDYNDYDESPRYPLNTWRNGTQEHNATNPGPFGIMIYIKPYKKCFYRYKSGKTKIEYNSMSGFGPSESKGFPNLEWLEGLTTIAPPPNAKIKEIEYSEETALFFINLIKSMCLLNEKIKDFLHPDGILQLIQNNQKLLG